MSAIDELHKNPAFASISPVKMVFLEQILTELQKQNKDTMIPFFLAVTARADQLGITFSDQETELLMGELEKNMSSEEKKRLQTVRTVMQNQAPTEGKS